VERPACVALAVVLLFVITASAVLAAPAYFPVDRNVYPYYRSFIKWEKTSAGFTEPGVYQGCHPQQYEDEGKLQ
jgi:hypothetical protein